MINIEEFNFPIAETFHSIQGEGSFTGTPMLFIRLAGCNVGRFTGSPHTECTSCLGEKFTCDTDYNRTGQASTEKLLELVKSSNFYHVCLTGGEPFLYPIKRIQEAINKNNPSSVLHIETSGTLPIKIGVYDWITCSPKVNYLPENSESVDEFKFLVNTKTTLEGIHSWLEKNVRPFEPTIFLQPIEAATKEESAENLKHTLKLLWQQPNWRISCQLHKYLFLS